MSYPNEMTKNTLDSIIKRYVDAISAFKKQDNIKPLDLRLDAGILPFYLKVRAGVSLPTQLEDGKYTSEHTVVTSNGIIPGSFDTKPFGMSPSDPLREALGCFWVMDPILGPTYAKNQLNNALQQQGGENYFNGSEVDGESIYVIATKIGASFSYNSVYTPGLVYRTIPEYFKRGVEHFEFTEPNIYTPTKPFDFKAPILNVGYSQYLKIHYNFTKAAIKLNSETSDVSFSPDNIKKFVPLTLFSGIEQKNEGVKVYYSPYEGEVREKTSYFKESSASETKWDSYFPINRQFNSADASSLNQNTLNSILSRAFGTNAPSHYEDHSFSSKAAISGEVTSMFGDELTQNDAFADINPVYNFTSPFWEKATNNFKLFPGAGDQESVNNELAIGNIYAYCFGKNDEEKLKFEFNKYGNKLLYCGLDVDQPEAIKYSNLFFTTSMSQYSKKVEDIKQQFPMYNEIDFKSEPIGELGIMMKESGMLLEFFETILSFMYNANVPLPELTDPELNSIFSSWEELESVGILNAGYYSSFEPNITNNRSIVTKIKKPAVLTDNPESYILENKPVGDYNFLRWLETYIQYLADPEESWNPSRSLSYIKRYTKFFGLDENGLIEQLADFTPQKIFGLAKFMPKFQKFVSLKTRALHDIMSADKDPNKLAYSETIMYRIEKVDVDTSTVLQNIFIPLDALQETIKYIDTQVRYGRVYQYKIMAIKAVIGTEYKYNPFISDTEDFNSNPKLSIAQDTFVPGTGKSVLYGDQDLEVEDIITSVESGGVNFLPLFSTTSKPSYTENVEEIGLSVIEVKYRPTVRIIEVPYYAESQVAIVDNPPMPPLTNIYPLSGKKNKLLLTFENQTGDRNLVPIPVQDGDSLIFDAIRFYQKRFTRLKDGSLFDPTIRFKADDVALEYQVFKIAGIKPTSYKSFSNALAATISMEKLQAGYEDTIATNTKYYYIFRTIDRHGSISNPTPVYEVEMVEDSGVAYPIIKIMDDFESPKEYMLSKPFRRYMMIDAADQQIFLNEDKTGITDDETALTGIDPVLGTANKSLWNDKLFKFRIKSKQTGKIIDLNLRFKTRNITDGNENINLCD